MSNLPVDHASDAEQLRADAKLDLYEIVLVNNGGVIRFYDGPARNWNGYFWESVGSKLSGEEKDSGEKKARPGWVIASPDDVFAPYVVSEDSLEEATVTRYRVLRAHLDADAAIYERSVWKVSRIAEVGNQRLTLELRFPSQGPQRLLPARIYMPPEFPTVSIKT